MNKSPIEHILVVGGGSAGFLAAITLKTKFPQIKVDLLRSPEIGIIGVGEGTTPTVPVHLFGYLGIDPAEFYREANPMWKLGLKMLWGPRPYFNYTFTEQTSKWPEGLSRPSGFYADEEFSYMDVNSSMMSEGKVFRKTPDGDPIIVGDFGYHIENELFVGFLEKHAVRVGINIIDATITTIDRDDHGVTAVHTESGQSLSADFYVDCSGFRALLIGQTMGVPFDSFNQTLFCNRAVVGGWNRRPNEPIKPYTTVETMECGWCWQIEHEHRIIRGYVYSSSFITDEAAEAELRQKNPQIGSTRIVPFSPGRRREAWQGNVIAIGNAGGFVEPLEATALSGICWQVRTLTEYLGTVKLQPTESVARRYNKADGLQWDETRDFLGVHYKFNTRIDNEFWRTCHTKTNIDGVQQLVDYYLDNGPTLYGQEMFTGGTTNYGIEGYLTMLVGQKVPHNMAFQPSSQERERWNQMRMHNKQTVLAKTVTVEEALKEIRSPEWTWTPGFYKQLMNSGQRFSSGQTPHFMG
jgi:tryptophan halogenase